MSNLDYDINLCMSVKNLKNNKNEQCPNKRKFGEYCGKHSNGKCKLRIDKFKNLEINKKKIHLVLKILKMN